MTDSKPTRVRLLEAAMSIIESEGEVGVRVDAVSEMAGVAKPSLYHFFGDRDGLVTAAWAEMYRRSLIHGLHELRDAVRSATSAAEYRAMILTAVSSFSSPDGVKRRAMRTSVLGSAVTRPDLQSAVVEINRQETSVAAEIFEIGLKNGWSTLRFAPTTAGLWWWGMLNGRHLAEIDPTSDFEEWDRLALDAIVNLLFSP